MAGVVCGLVAGWCAGTAVASWSIAKGGHLRLDGDSTLHPYHADALVFRARVDVAPGPAGDGMEGAIRAHRVTAVDFSLPVSGLRSGESGLDENLRKALKADRFSTITFHETGYEVLAGPGFVLSIDGTLSIAGVERAVNVRAEARKTADGVRLSGTVPLKMTDFDVQPPILMLGMLKTADKVTVTFDFELAAPAGAAL